VQESAAVVDARRSSNSMREKKAAQSRRRWVLIAQAEKGEPVSTLNVQRIAKKLAVDASALLESERPSSESPLVYCSSTRCPSLCLAANNGELFIMVKGYGVIAVPARRMVMAGGHASKRRAATPPIA
jgi:hypothetical protein